MLNIKHFPILDTEAVLEHYKSEGPYKCVCVEQINYTPINIEELK